MIDMSDKEFEQKIVELVNGQTTKTKLVKELKTDFRTLERKVLSKIPKNNPELYNEYVEKYSYKTNERDDIDYEALVIEIIKTKMNNVDAARKYNLGVRTIQRKINKLEETNPELVSLYREIKEVNKSSEKVPDELEEKISKLVTRPVKISEINEKRKTQLEQIIDLFNGRCLEYATKEEAAESMGVSYEAIYKYSSLLKRIKSEEASRESKGKVNKVKGEER